MKTIIQRGLSLNQKYVLIDKKYIPIEQSAGAYCCDNCGQIIANIATVKDEHGRAYSIGFDCLETILINNSLLSSGDIQQYEKTKKMIPKILRFAKTLKETIRRNGQINITGLFFEKPLFGQSFTYYWLTNGQSTSRNNNNVKLKEMEYKFLIDTIKNIFPKLTILTEIKP